MCYARVRDMREVTEGWFEDGLESMWIRGILIL